MDQHEEDETNAALLMFMRCIHVYLEFMLSIKVLRSNHISLEASCRPFGYFRLNKEAGNAANH